jgi:glyoxylase-like metal-dependent hydrolase (beta-lactamase superfamily II)
MSGPSLLASSVVGLILTANAPHAEAEAVRWCDELPRPAYRKLERVAEPDDWFQVYRVADGVFAIYEPFQFQEVISYLILGSREAVLFDTGLGIGTISTVVAHLTRLPVTVVNSHTHFDHIGGNAEFERILAMDTAYTRANTRGFARQVVAGEVAAEALCRPLPPGVDPATYRTRPFTPTRFIQDGHEIDLGDRRLEVLHVPGHTPDAIALLDAAAGSLWTGDTFYEGPIWLFVPETDWRAYAASVDRLAALAPKLKRLFPAHNVAGADPAVLLRLQKAVAEIRSGQAKGKEEGEQITFDFDGFAILTSRRALEGKKKSDPAQGGSGLPVVSTGGDLPSALPRLQSGSFTQKITRPRE